MTSTITDERLNEILDGCENVTPGPWQVYDGCSWRRIGTDPGRGAYDCAVLAPCVASDGHPDLMSTAGDREANLAHIARLDPATVAAMASELLAAREVLSSSGAEAKIAEQAAEIERLKRARAPNIEFNTTDGSATRIRALSGNRSGN